MKPCCTVNMKQLKTRRGREYLPVVLQPGFLPAVMSLKPDEAVEYISGFTNPSVDLPFASLKSFRSAKTAAAV